MSTILCFFPQDKTLLTRTQGFFVCMRALMCVCVCVCVCVLIYMYFIVKYKRMYMYMYLYLCITFLLFFSFHEAMKHFTLSQPLPSLSSSSSPLSSFSPLSPPHSLLPYHPLLLLTNSLISAFNDLRSCAPVALAPEVSREVERLLQSTVHDIGEYYR